MDQMEAILAKFKERFADGGLTPPEMNLICRTPGIIDDGLVHICFIFGEDDRGTYLDYYASFRFNDDEHVRIYQDGTVEELPAYAAFVAAGVMGEDR